MIFVASSGAVFVISPTGVIREFKLDENKALPFKRDDPSLGLRPLIVADSVVPVKVAVGWAAVVLSSPARVETTETEHLKAYNKQRLYMPLPTEEEVLAMRDVAFPHRPLSQVKLCMQLWGPIPRHVLVHGSKTSMELAWEKACAVNLDLLIAFVRRAETGGGKFGEAPHRLYCERCAGQDTDGIGLDDPRYYKRGHPVVASATVMQFIAESVSKAGKWNATFLLDSSLAIGALGAWRRTVTEELALELLEAGGSFTCRELSAAGAAKTLTLALPDRPRQVFGDADDLNALRAEHCLLVPDRRDYAGLDGFVWDHAARRHWPVDVTVSKAHGIHAQGLYTSMVQMGWSATHPTPIKYFWAVPEHSFNAGWKTAQVAKPGSDSTAEAQAVMAHLRQYAICLEATTQVTQLLEKLKAKGTPHPEDILSKMSD